ESCSLSSECCKFEYFVAYNLKFQLGFSSFQYSADCIANLSRCDSLIPETPVVLLHPVNHPIVPASHIQTGFLLVSPLKGKGGHPALSHLLHRVIPQSSCL